MKRSNFSSRGVLIAVVFRDLGGGKCRRQCSESNGNQVGFRIDPFQ
jgi:hypothetical protein